MLVRHSKKFCKSHLNELVTITVQICTQVNLRIISLTNSIVDKCKAIKPLANYFNNTFKLIYCYNSYNALITSKNLSLIAMHPNLHQSIICDFKVVRKGNNIFPRILVKIIFF